ncbi:hypothetical protein [Zooshikella sp. RANM57]|uniref:hypothetical protein n=1 Tax=Zooshikella sp. RANM57 TaxID=3425863 RepID=UPI003D6EE7E2
MLTNKLAGILLFGFCFLDSVSAVASNLDCEDYNDNKIYCRNPELRNKHDHLLKLYNSLHIAASDWSVISKQKSKWQATRNKCKTSECFIKVYDEQIRYLEQYPDICRGFKDDFFHGNPLGYDVINPELNGSLAEIISGLGKEGEKVKSIILEYSDTTNYVELYKVDINNDKLGDYIIVVSDGKADCKTHLFFVSTGKGLTLINNADFSSYENEGKLCANWGQKLSFVSYYNNGIPSIYALLTDTFFDDGFATISFTPLAADTATTEICKFKIGFIKD